MALATRNEKISFWLVNAFFVALGTSTILSFLSYLSSGSLGNNLLLNFGVSPKEIFQRNMTWFLTGEIIIIALILIWRYRRKNKKQRLMEKEL